MEKVPLTQAGYDRLQQELKNLKSVQRPAIIRAISEAREHGDLSENAEYSAAKEKQSFIEGRILELEDKISRADVINPEMVTGDTIKFSATVTLIDDDTEKEVTYQLLGVDEADLSKGLISITSPLGRALIGKKAGDAIEVNTPGGGKGYEILSVQYV
jgi:transcription elongation factor GreA